jgi:hypothetical protein
MADGMVTETRRSRSRTSQMQLRDSYRHNPAGLTRMLDIATLRRRGAAEQKGDSTE